MAFRLLRAGTIQREELGSTGVYVTYRVPDRQVAKEIMRQIDLWQKKMDRYTDVLSAAVGRVIDKLEGIELDGENEYTIEKTSGSELTDEALGIILPLGQELLEFILSKINLNYNDRKN